MVNPDARQFRFGPVLRMGQWGPMHAGVVVGPDGVERSVTLEIPDSPIRAEVARRLRAEAITSHRLDSEHVIPTEDPAWVDDRWVIVRDAADGVDLEVLLSHGKLPTGPALHVVACIAHALDAWASVQDGTSAGGERHLDARSVVIGPTGAVRVFDIGAADVYLLGGLMHRLLTGKALEDRRGEPDAHARSEQAADAVWEVFPDMELASLQAKMLAHAPGDRAQATDVAQTCSRVVTVLELGSLQTWAQEHVPPRMAPPGELGPVRYEAAAPAKTETARPARDAGAPRDSVPRSPLAPPPLAPPPSKAWQPNPEEEDTTRDPTAKLEGRAPVRSRKTFEEAPTDRRVAVAGATGVDPRVVVGVGAAVLVIVALVVWMGGWLGPAPVEAAVIAPPAPVVAPVVVAPIEAPPAPDPVVVAPIEAPPAPDPVVVAPIEAPPPPQPARVSLSGDATAVTLVSGAKRVAVPGPVPAGSWTIEAAFAGEPLVAGQIDLVAGGAVELACNGLFTRCAATQ